MERKRKRLASPLQRKVHIDGKEWTYSPGHTTFILNPARDNKISVRQIDFFPGLTWDTLERAEDKGYAHQFAVTPSVIKEWIETKMLGKVFKETLRVRQIVSVTKRGGKVSLTSFGGSDLLACTVKWPDGKTRVLALSEEEVRQLRSRCEVTDTEPIPVGGDQ